MNKAYILVSGGIDSVVTAYYVKKKLNYRTVTFLFFNYGQRTAREEERFSRVHAKILGADFIKIELPWLGELSNSLINKKRKKSTSLKQLQTEKENAIWYVPARNTVFLACALAYAEASTLRGEIGDIFVGFKNEGRLHYPDTTQGFLEKLNRFKSGIIQGKFLIKAPLLKYDKDQVIRLGNGLGVDYAQTYSCYQGANNNKHCGICMNCRLRQEGFYWANMDDLTKYEKRPRDYRDFKTLE